MFILLLIFPAAESWSKQKNKPKEITLTLASYIPVGYPYCYEGLKLFIDMVNKQGKGVVQINSYFSGTLLGGKELIPGLHAGATDIIIQTGSYLLGTYPIVGIQVLPVWDEILESYRMLKIGAPLARLQNEVLKKKNLFILSAPGLLPAFLWTKKKMVRSPQDMKGLKIRVPGKVEAKIIQALGAFPVTIPSAELPPALQRGVIDGALITPWTAKGRGIEEFCKYMLVYPMSWQSPVFVILWDKWNSWPENVRKLLLEVSAEWEDLFVGVSGPGFIYDEQLSTEVIPFYEKHGMQAVYLSPEEVETFDNAIKPVIEWWVKEVGESRGREALKYTDKLQGGKLE